MAATAHPGITRPSQLPYQAGWQDLKDLFRSAGNIVRADINIGADGRPKGSGTVIFETAKDAQQAISKKYATIDFTQFLIFCRHVQWVRLVRTNLRSARGRKHNLTGSNCVLIFSSLGPLRWPFWPWILSRRPSRRTPWFAGWLQRWTSRKLPRRIRRRRGCR